MRKRYHNIVHSIAFLPAVIALAFLIVSWLMIYLDFSETGKNIKSYFEWLSLKDATTARSIISSIVSGIISLTVFSFSMVMIVLNQAASQLSNRILDKLIGNRFQQTVLGFYIGTIVYALFLLSTIRDIDKGVHVPALSTYLLIFLTVGDIFLFIYFLHYITQSVKFENIIHRIYRQSINELKHSCINRQEADMVKTPENGIAVNAPSSGIFQGFEKKTLLNICKDENIVIFFLYPLTTWVLKDKPLFYVVNSNGLSEKCNTKLNVSINIERGEDIKANYYYGLRQLMEIAIKALSPGINDPGTAVLSLHALADLLAFTLEFSREQYIKDEKGTVRIIIMENTFEKIFLTCLLPIWNYGKNDRLIQDNMQHVLEQLQLNKQVPVVNKLLMLVRSSIAARDM